MDSRGSAGPADPATIAAAASGLPSPEPNLDLRRAAVGVFRETALLYLSSVLSGSVPGKRPSLPPPRALNEAPAHSFNPCTGVPEIGGSVNALVGAVQQLPPGAADRVLVLPLTLAGCLTDDPGQRKMFRTRLLAQQLANGTVAQAAAVMDQLWQQRDTRGVAIDWRRIMVDRRMNLLLV